MFEAVIGIEVHCELKTKSKMFSPAPVSFGSSPNTKVHVIDLAMPGTLPTVNQKAVEMAVRVCHVLQMKIDDLLRFDRKNYYYADSPKGFQITQYSYPIGRNGYLDIEVDNEFLRIDIERLHLEEDTAKMTHLDNCSLIDYNRAGIPLIEIVTKPQLHNSQQACAYLESLRMILIYTGVSDAIMAEGSMRCDINISLHPHGFQTLGEKVEIKNVNSLSNVQKAIDFEIQRQTGLLSQGLPVLRQTRRFDEKTQTTQPMREKESLLDYRYYPEPNILPIRLDKQWIQMINDQLPLMPQQRKYIYHNSYGLSFNETHILLSNKDLADFFEQVTQIYPSYQIVCHMLIGDVMSYLRCYRKSIFELLEVKDFAQLIELLDNGKISSKQAKQLLELMINKKKDPLTLMKEFQIDQISDDQTLISYIEEIFETYPHLIADYHAGKDKVIGFFVGQIMKRTQGQAHPQKTNQLLKQLLEKRKT